MNDDLVDLIQRSAQPGSSTLDAVTTRTLTALTELLVNECDTDHEYERFQQIQRRSLHLPTFDYAAGKTVLVTGGTGCIGTILLQQLVQHPHGRIICMSREVTPRVATVPGVEYMSADVQSATEVDALFAMVRPDIVFHLAAVRHPGQAELEPQRTVQTNVLGTWHIVQAADKYGVQRLITSSTGKAVRFWTGDVYAQTKKVVEWIMSTSRCPVHSYVRFTHVADNSIVLERLLDWGASGAVIRLHDPSIYFYIQSALESAQLMMCAAAETGMYAIRNLGLPMSLVDLTVGVLKDTKATSPIYFCGFEAGYEELSYQALYDPQTGGDVGPLINSLESYSAREVAGGQLNHVPILRACRGDVEPILEQLRDAVSRDESVLRGALHDATWAVLDTLLSTANPVHLTRAHALAARMQPGSAEHQMISLQIEKAYQGVHLTSAVPATT